MADKRGAFDVEITEPAAWAITNLLAATKQVHEAMRRGDLAVRRSFLRQAQMDIANATTGLNEALALCSRRPDKAPSAEDK